ncbi:hypothetical protein [Halogeometricum limi]|uniref:Uncharacterized protein n=1 Tax=Halogeometricum limi TaxID=555875 RepID=A0A1I6ILU0_9EURY|nr:hypothetical protein [Halogeometricum limi]SFR67702.1 hypothetical protein SAMN04488124_3393 [Halogeometricum limi]
MRRRRLLQLSGVAVTAAVAGCLGNNPPPPRRSNAISDVALGDQSESLTVNVADDPWVMSRYDADTSGSLAEPSSVLAALSPVGLASAQKGGGRGGSGATGRGTGGYTTAPRTGHGYAVYHGGDDDDEWYENHRDEVQRYGAAAGALGFAYLGSNAAFTDDPPGPGPVPWDEKRTEPSDTETFDLSRPGWYRVATKLDGENVNHDFGWAAVDVRVDSQFGQDSYDIEEEWKVSPRI